MPVLQCLKLLTDIFPAQKTGIFSALFKVAAGMEAKFSYSCVFVNSGIVSCLIMSSLFESLRPSFSPLLRVSLSGAIML